MQEIQGWRGGRIKAFTDGVEFEHSAQEQAHGLASLHFIHEHVAIMPDVHMGIGSSVGTVIPTHAAIIPAAVGVDIGCGMNAVKTTLTANQLPDSLAPLRSMIEAAVPHGGPGPTAGWGSRSGTPKNVMARWRKLEKGFDVITEKHRPIKNANSLIHLGSLGGGNHFIEICLDGNGSVWVMLHSGSRGVGNRIGGYFIQKARERFESYAQTHGISNADLCWLDEGSQDFKDYIEAMLWAQDFARENREVMMENVLRVLKENLPPFELDTFAVNCHHNFAQKENHFGKDVWITRKGAVEAREGQLGIIPGSMGARSYIVRGKGNADSFNSCSHGAGRRMRRMHAKELISIEDHIKATEGVECRKDRGVLDESPAAYKDIDAVMAAQSDLVEVVAILKQVLCVKG